MLNEWKLGKYKFKFTAPTKTTDAHGYYSLEPISNIPRDYIRVFFTIRLADTDKKSKSYSVSLSTWEAIKGKYLTILCHKIKDDYIDTQIELMEDIKELLLKKYRQSIPTIIYPDLEETETELQEE